MTRTHSLILKRINIYTNLNYINIFHFINIHYIKTFCFINTYYIIISINYYFINKYCLYIDIYYTLLYYIYGLKKKGRTITWPKGQDIFLHAAISFV